MTCPLVAIIGGGVSGLAAAYELSQLGIPFVLYEREPHCGGVVRTEYVDGYTIDAGPDTLLTHKPAAIDLCRALGLAALLHPQLSRTTFIVRGGRLRPLPEASVMGIPTRWMPFATTNAFSWTGKLRMAAEVLLPAAPPANDESIASFIGRRFGREAVDYLAEPLLAGIHGGDPARLSMRSAFPEFLELEARDRSVIIGLRRAGHAARPSASAGCLEPVEGRATACWSAAPSPFLALSGGMSELTRALVASLPRGTIQNGVGVEGIEPSRLSASSGRPEPVEGRGGYLLRLIDGVQVRVPAVLVATPPPIAGRVLQSLDKDLSALCARIPTASVVTVALGFARSAVRHALNGTGLVVPRREGLRVRAVSWASSKWEGRAPADRVLLRAYLGGAIDPHAIDLNEATLVGRAHQDMTALLGIAGEPELARVYRWHDAAPQREVGHLDLMGKLESRLAMYPGLFLTGSGFRRTGIAGCVADGRRQAGLAAARLSSGQFLSRLG